MLHDLSPGDVIRIEDCVTLTVLAVEGNLIHFGLESPDEHCRYAGSYCRQAEPTQSRWEYN